MCGYMNKFPQQWQTARKGVPLGPIRRYISSLNQKATPVPCVTSAQNKQVQGLYAEGTVRAGAPCWVLCTPFALGSWILFLTITKDSTQWALTGSAPENPTSTPTLPRGRNSEFRDSLCLSKPELETFL